MVTSIHKPEEIVVQINCVFIVRVAEPLIV